MNTTIDHALLLELVAFVDQEHEYTSSAGCHPQPRRDCVEWCDACKLLIHLPSYWITGARELLNERGIERD